MSRPTPLSVVIPTLDEEGRLPSLLRDLEPLKAEVIVVDGGSSDRTLDVARDAGVRTVVTEAGRGIQLRAGAEAARGRWLFFVHADCRLDPDAREALRTFLETARERDFAHFDFALDRDEWIHRFIEFGQDLRERWLGLIYGDQGLVVSRRLYDDVGGHPDWPLMEDVEVVRRLAALGRRVSLPAVLTTSARRYDREGGLRRWARNVLLMAGFRLGVSPHRLSRWYRPRGHAPKRIVGVFAKAPAPGRVKTRLAADVGDRQAVEIYRAMGRAIVDELRGGPYRLVVYGDPPDEESLDAIRSWLGPDGLEVRPQTDGDLGRRMHAALTEALEEADEALLVGADIPGIDQPTVRRAFAALAEDDVVLGPATDGGYYLVGLSSPCHELFREMPWSTSRVLAETMRRAGSAGLQVGLLEEKSDVDTVDDLNATDARRLAGKARELR